MEHVADLAAPTYDRSRITTGIAHIGVGNFHRSHQAMYIDRLMNRGLAHDWGIVGIGLLPGDVHMRDALRAQHFAYTLVERHGDGSVRGRIIGAMVDYRFAPDDPEGTLALLTSPAIRIVSLTITEGGYNIDRASGEFLLDTPAIVADIAHPGAPGTVFGYLTEALRCRRAAGIAPFTVMSCDNLPGNGQVARRAVTAFAQAVDPELAQWIATNVAFPNAMVDRITPVTTAADSALVRDTFGIDDAWPVMTEPFAQWVLEDQFPAGRPPLEEAGVQLVHDVVPYELMKLRLLNASHQAMAYIGMLLGYTYVHEAVADARIELFLRGYLHEARQTLPVVQGQNIDTYIEELFVRFRNPFIADTLARLAVDASDRLPKFVLPSIRDNLAAGREVPFGAAVVATWAEYLRRANQESVADGLRDVLYAAIRAGDFLACTPVFGDLGRDAQFIAAYNRRLAQIAADPAAILP